VRRRLLQVEELRSHQEAAALPAPSGAGACVRAAAASSAASAGAAPASESHSSFDACSSLPFASVRAAVADSGNYRSRCPSFCGADPGESAESAAADPELSSASGSGALVVFWGWAYGDAAPAFHPEVEAVALPAARPSRRYRVEAVAPIHSVPPSQRARRARALKSPLQSSSSGTSCLQS
jgi:hypothetical protein